MQADSITTIVDLFRYAVARDRTDLIKFKRDANWQTLSARQLDEQVRLAAMGLYELGVRAGDHVGLLSENCIEWTIADLAVLNCGAADVPIYSTQAPKQVAYILNDAGVEVIFISNQKQYDRVCAELSSCPRLRVIVAFEPFSSSQSRVISFADLLRMGQQADRAEPQLYDTLRATVRPASVATLIYTSGTTGDPKGVMLTHANLVSNAITNAGIAQMNEGETALSFLPFSHVFERMTIYMYLYAGSTIYYAQSMDTVAEDLLAARPHFMTSVPRLFEKIYARAMEKAEEGGRVKAAIARWALVQASEWAKLVTNGKEPGALLKFKHAIADRLVFTKWRAALGGRIRGLVSGGAPLSPELALAFYGAGITIYQGYGMTESSPVIATNYPGANRIGSVGKPIPGVRLKIAEDGEILCSGPNVMPGYYNRAEETKAALETDRDGRVWLHTGDIGRLDADGFLFITDRKKDLLKTSGGKYIAPQPIENAIKQSRFVNQVVVIGDQRKFPAALIVPQMDILRAYAAQNGIAEDGQALLNNPRIVDLIEKEVERCTGDFSHYEKVKGIILIDREMTIENGELTPTLKVRRRVVVDHHRESIDQLYTEKEAHYTTKK
ncbi:MAG: long-chain fatty acid--CoA ligase [Blastocatellia bacterium]|nr:long-chain fatty acid--CoA ligase [Blastocatellia bacterium]